MEKPRIGEVLRFSEICRLCLHSNCQLLPLLDGNRKFPEKLASILPALTVDREDRLPLQVCEKCVQRLDDSYEFKLLCEHSNAFLQRHIESQEFPVAQVNSDDELVQVEDELSSCSVKTEADRVTSKSHICCKYTAVGQNKENIHKSEEEIAKCASCASDGSTPKQSSRHLEHQASDPEVRFSSGNNMVLPGTNVHNPEKPHMCLSEHAALLQHEKEHLNHTFSTHHKHLPSDSRLFSCSQCEKSFETDAALLNHKNKDSCVKERNDVSEVLQERTSVFKCEKCNITFPTHSEYTAHICEHSNQFSSGKLCKYKAKIYRGKLTAVKKESRNGAELNVQYSCEHCDKTFSCRTKYFAHIVSHSDARPFECLICGKRFKYQSNLSNHKTLHVKTGPFVCTHCGRTFGNRSHLAKHAASHSEERPHQCSVCGKCFKHKSNLCNHKALHVENGSHLCTHCGKSFATKSILARHVAMHSGERPYRCPYCNKGFKHMSNMCNHKALHLQKSPFLCAVCGKSFSSRSNLTTHSAAHSEDRCHQCNICGKAFKFRSSLNSHVSLHSLERPHACKICGRSFRCRSTFVNHVRAHTGEKPHRCGICSKDFTTLSNLIVHRRVHSGEKPYTCMECGKAFSDRGNLSAHQAVHTPDRPHACPTCRQTFKYHSSMKRHIRKRHGGVGLPASAPKLLSVEKY